MKNFSSFIPRGWWAWLTGVVLLLSISPARAEQKPLVFWHTQSKEGGPLISQIIADYNATNPPIKVQGLYQGTYNDIYDKTKANLIAKNPPDLAVAYESMVAEYQQMYGVADLDPLIKDPKIGLSPADLNDFFPIFLQGERYPDYHNATLSFPFTKSLLILYVNNDLLKQAGFSAAPRTWDEFEKQCLALKKIGKKGYAMYVEDPSTLDGMFMSQGADLYDAATRKTHFDAPGVVQTLAMLHRFLQEGAAYQVDGLNDEDVTEFAQGRCAFMIKSSTRRPTITRDVAGKFQWSMNPMPSGDGRPPMTVLYGGNICIFPTGEERVRAAWQFIKYFTSPEITARWAVGSGYLPVRKSAEKSKTIQDWFAQSPVNRQFFAMIPLAQSEPIPRGWQEVRKVIQNTATDAAIGRGGSPEDLAKSLKAQADAILNPPPPSSGITIKILLVLLLLVGVGLIVRAAVGHRPPGARLGPGE